jgi:hypothetical protein
MLGTTDEEDKASKIDAGWNSGRIISVPAVAYMVKIGRPAGLLPQDDEPEMRSHYADIYYCGFMTSILLISPGAP